MQKDENVAAERTEDSAYRLKEATKDTLKNAGDYLSAKTHNVKEDIKDSFERSKVNQPPSSAEYAPDDLQQSQGLGTESSARSSIPANIPSASQGDSWSSSGAQALGREDYRGSDWPGGSATGSSVARGDSGTIGSDLGFSAGSGDVRGSGQEKSWTESAKEKLTDIKERLADTFQNPTASTQETAATGLRKTGDVEEDLGRFLERDADKRRHQLAEERNVSGGASYSSNP